MSPANTDEATLVAAAEKLHEEVTGLGETVKKFLSRDEWLSAAGKLKEEEHYVEGLGWLVLSEVTGDVRAEIVGDQSAGLMADNKRIDVKQYQRKLILNGVVDPTTPEGGRKPMFRPGDLDQVMKVGGRKIAEVVDIIERLSSLGQYGSQEAVAGNSADTQSGGSTS